MLRRHVPRAVVLALGVGILAAVVDLLSPGQRRIEALGQTESDLGRAMESRLEAMEGQVSALASRIEALESNRGALREPVEPEPASHVEQADTSLVGLAERIAHLEQLERTRARRVVERKGDWPSNAQTQPPRDRIEAAQEIIRDTTVSDSDKAHAWLDLAEQEVYPWTDDIIAEMTSIGLTSKNDRAREVVWIGAESEHRSDLLVQPLLSALSDAVADLREEAADALSQYRRFRLSCG